MLSFIGKRLLVAIPTLLVIITLAFALLHAAPGGPFDSDKVLVPEIRAAIEARYHLDEPVPMQYLRYLGGVVRGDFGPSFQYQDSSVNDLIAQGLPIDLAIGLLAMGLALLIGVPLGVVAALRRNTVWDRAASAIALLGISVPTYVTAPLLVLLFAVSLRWLPAGDWGEGALRNLVLPVVALSLPYVAYIARLLRASLLDVLHTPWVRTARAKGMPWRTVLLRHALRPALLPLVAFLGPATVGVITGSIAIETVFGLPGIGRFFVDGAFNRDYTVVMGVTILYGVLIVLANLLADVVQALLDPRMRP
ncbi:MAG: oligopeptide ABC transporter permease OppB [Proteobacteria bacterium]|nr:oligopeptide ABC transporter permease OppB [Pseudomonadota bacterium]